jgi:hypothetical protein
MSSYRFESDFLPEAVQVADEYLRLALSERFLSLQTEDILGAAESVWNNYEPGVGPPFVEMSINLYGEEEESSEAEEELFDALIDELHQVRCERFSEMSFFLLALDYEYEKDDVLFTCDLVWPNGAAVHPFQLRIARQLLAPPEQN